MTDTPNLDTTQFVVDFTSGPGLVGPFATQEKAEAWVDRFVHEYNAIRPDNTGLSWHVGPLLTPDTLAWWNQ